MNKHNEIIAALFAKALMNYGLKPYNCIFTYLFDKILIS